MALIDRIRERIETDLSDDELGEMIAGIAAEIEVIYGAVAGEVTVSLGDPTEEGRSRLTLRLARALDKTQAVTLVEIDPAESGATGNRTTLDDTDYRVLHGGRTLQRLTSGSHAQRYWAPLVEITYTPADAVSERARDEATIKLIKLDLSYRGLIKSEKAGDYQWSGSLASDSYATERNNLLASLGAGRNSMVMA